MANPFAKKNMRILVTGATGMLGKELCPMLEAEGWQYWATNSKIFDVTNTKLTNEIMNKVSLEFIIHLAGYTNIDLAEVDPEQAYLVNQMGTRNIAKIAKKLNVPILYVSTDMVFDGAKGAPYKTNDATNPISVYGKSKFLGEEEIRKITKKHYIIRTSWLYGRGERDYVNTMLTFSNLRDEISVVDDQIGCPTWTRDLAQKIVSIIKEEREFGTYHICASGHTNWSGFTKEILKNRNTKVISIDKSDFPRPAKRPTYSVLDNNNELPDWKNSLSEYLLTR